MRLSQAPRPGATAASPVIGEAAPEMVSVEVWHRESGPVVDNYQMHADEMGALGSEEARQWLRKFGW
jgi:hypothetical protein